MKTITLLDNFTTIKDVEKKLWARIGDSLCAFLLQHPEAQHQQIASVLDQLCFEPPESMPADCTWKYEAISSDFTEIVGTWLASSLQTACVIHTKTETLIGVPNSITQRYICINLNTQEMITTPCPEYDWVCNSVIVSAYLLSPQPLVANDKGKEEASEVSVVHEEEDESSVVSQGKRPPPVKRQTSAKRKKAKKVTLEAITATTPPTVTAAE